MLFISTILVSTDNTAQLTNTATIYDQSWLPILAALLLGTTIGFVAFHKANKQTARTDKPDTE